MPSGWRAWFSVGLWLLAALCGLAPLQRAQAEHPSELSSAVMLGEHAGQALQAQVKWWMDTSGQASIAQVASPGSPARFSAMSHEAMFPLQPPYSLWVKLELRRKSDADKHWVLRIPIPLIDQVSLFTQEPSSGRWDERRAGDRLLMAQWSEKGRYPRFHLDLSQETEVIYLRIRGSTPISVPLRIGSMDETQVDEQLGHLGLGIIGGFLLLLSLICVVTAITYRDTLYGLYGAYVLLMILAVASYTGLAMQFIWPFAPAWSDASQGALAILTAGGAMWFIDAVLTLRSTMPRLSTALRVWGLLALLAAAVYAALPRPLGVVLLAVFVTVGAMGGLYAAQIVWRRGAIVGLWVLLAYAPLVLAVMMAVARAQGWIAMSWLVQYGVVVALLIEVPMMLLALHAHSRERHAAQTRERALATQDALTGLLAGHIFEDRVLQAVSRMQRSREDAAIVLISLVNHDRIMQVHGPQIAEQSIVRSVIKLRRVLGDADTPSRVGRHEFAVLIEGSRAREPIMQMSTRLIALGLMPLKGLVPEVTLQFHVAAVLLREHPRDSLGDGSALLDRLREMIAGMSSRTRRPIRFLESADTQAMPLPSASGAAASTALRPTLTPAAAELLAVGGSPAAVQLEADSHDTSSGPASTTQPQTAGNPTANQDKWYRDTVQQSAADSAHASTLPPLPHEPERGAR